MGNVRETFSYVFSSGGSHKPHSKAIKDLQESWGFQKVVFDLADSKIEKVAEINQQYLTDFLTFLTFLIQKGEADEEEDKFQETLRKAKSKGR